MWSGSQVGRAVLLYTVVGASLFTAARSVAAEGAPQGPVDDGRDHYTLFYRHPVNRELAAQLQAPDESYRLGRAAGRWAFAADLSLGSEQAATPATTQARFHGFYLVDTYLSAHLLDGLEANLNMLLFNPSSSDGYRLSAQIATGFALHGWLDLATLGSRRLRLDVFGTDLGWVTVGVGLLVEQVPLEGATARLSWEPVDLTYTFAGRVFWDDDDLSRLELSVLHRRLGLTWVDWRVTDQSLAGALPRRNAQFLGAYADVPLPRGFRVAAEVALRPREGHESGALLRTDYLGRPSPLLLLHAGYQFRWYQRAFGPRSQVVQPTVPFNTPQQEDVYATNSFEYLSLTPLDDQWSHTVMVEGRARPEARLQLFAQSELWLRYASSSNGVVAFTPQGCSTPGHCSQLLYSAGVTARPWERFPHRLNAFITNKQVLAPLRADQTVPFRFKSGTYVVVEFQAFL